MKISNTSANERREKQARTNTGSAHTDLNPVCARQSRMGHGAELAQRVRSGRTHGSKRQQEATKTQASGSVATEPKHPHERAAPSAAGQRAKHTLQESRKPGTDVQCARLYSNTSGSEGKSEDSSAEPGMVRMMFRNALRVRTCAEQQNGMQCKRIKTQWMRCEGRQPRTEKDDRASKQVHAA